jgi:hypothetical protein
MPDLLNALKDPLILTIVAVAGTVFALAIIGGVWRARRHAAATRRRQADLRKHYGAMQMQHEELERLATRILATSSTGQIAGFDIQRQIEAVFTDGHPSPNKAVQVLKALAAQKGANALINLSGQRLPTGKCSAHGDAVIVRPTAG